MPKATVKLMVNGRAHEGWKSLQVSKSLDQMCVDFDLEYTDTFPPVGKANKLQPWTIKPGDSCKLLLNGTTVVNGFIDGAEVSYDGQTHDLSVFGRDVTCDLVDCSAASGEWKNTKVREIITKLIEPFSSVSLSIDPSAQAAANKVVQEFKVNEGDTVFALITKLGLNYGFRPMSFGDGKLTLTQTGTGKISPGLKLGENILSGRLSYDNGDRYSVYTIKGQGTGKDKFKQKDFVQKVKAQKLDTEITRYRPLTIIAETNANIGRCQTRANWEAVTRAGKSRTVSYTVQGWGPDRKSDALWEVNRLVSVEDAFLGINTSLLITSLQFGLSEQSGTITNMVLMAKEAYNELAPPADVDAKKGGKGGWNFANARTAPPPQAGSNP